MTGRGRILPPRSAARAREEKIRALEAELAVVRAEQPTDEAFRAVCAERDALKAELSDARKVLGEGWDRDRMLKESWKERCDKAEARVAELEKEPPWRGGGGRPPPHSGPGHEGCDECNVKKEAPR